jgi:hypothetical protein
VAHADRYFDFRGLWLMMGASAGYSFARDADGGAFGGEVSVVKLGDRRQGQELSWFGGYLEAEHQSGPDATRLSIGPEIGRDFYGADAGYVVDFGGDDTGTRHGLSVRGFLSVGVLSVYARFETLFGGRGDAGAEPFGEVGVLAKLPIPLD